MLCERAAGSASVIDFGAGTGQYRDGLRRCGLAWRGYDGAENIANATKHAVRWLDLAVPVWVGAAPWVLSLEVGEHIPAAGAAAYLDNLARHAGAGLVLSWALPAQGGHHHVNEQPAAWLIAQLAARGFAHDEAGTAALRQRAQKDWLKATTHVFLRASGISRRSR